MTFFSKLTFAAVAATAVGIAGGASANTLSFANINATWINPVVVSIGVQSNTTTGPQAGGALASIRWGQDAGNGFSGYDFQVNGDPVPALPGIAVETPFDLGTFTHINQPIGAGTSITSVDLAITGDILINGMVEQSNAQFDFRFGHEETPNFPGVGNCAAGGLQPCADRVTVSLLNSTDTFQVGDEIFTLSILGFIQGLNTVTQFISPENGSNDAIVRAEFTSEIAPIPLPAAGWLMVAGLGGLAAMRRRKSKKS